ncbi:MAG TPA: hypothetical protein VK858_00290 [Longimicrobiales bacterium]|nr:hypothetical protein [Longimicrobiales bacterium]
MRWSSRSAWIRGGLIALVAAGPIQAQEPVRGEALPEDVAADVLAFVNDPGTLRFEGDGVIPGGQAIQGNVALVGGLLTVTGEIGGSLVVLNGDLILGDSAHIAGDVLIVGGDLEEGDVLRIDGLVTIYERGYPVIRRDGQVLARPDRRQERPGLYIGNNARITVRGGNGYNRVEGLPILVGPVFRTSGDYPLELDALAIFRTESGFSFDDLGYQLRLEQAFGAAPRWSIGATAASEIVPIETRGVSDLEASLSTFFLHRDNRDYFSREGWTVSLEAQGESTPIRGRLTYRDESHYSVAPGGPWTLFRNDDEWRPLPLVAEGDFSALEAELEVDRRNDPEDPSDGWYLNATLARGLDGDLALPAWVDPDGGEVVGPTPVDDDWMYGTMDLRRYARIDPDSDLRFRLLLRGGLQAEELPPQFQSALGGVGSLPGYRRFALDCGARSVPADVVEGEEVRAAFPRYGCDRTALFQMEFREELDWNLDLSPDDEEEWDEWHWYPRIDLTAAFVAFMDVGRGWSYAPDGQDSDTLADLGLGFFVGKVGLYLALPLNGDDRNVSFFVRLQHRF